MQNQMSKTAVLALCLGLFLSASVLAADGKQCVLNGTSANDLRGCVAASGQGYQTAGSAIIGPATDADTGAAYYGVRSEGQAVGPIDAHGQCRWVHNNSPKAYFIPFKTGKEWTSFLNWASAQTAFEVLNCAFPSSGSYATVDATPGYAGCTAVSVNAPNEYGKFDVKKNKGVSLWPATPDTGKIFVCHDGGTAVSSALQWMALDGQAVGRSGLSWGQVFLYGPDVVLTGTATVNGTAKTGASLSVPLGTPVTLKWETGSTATVCSANGFAGPTGASQTGSVAVTPAAKGTYNYTITCQNQQAGATGAALGLSSTATVTVVVEETAAKCGTTVNSCTTGSLSNAEYSADLHMSSWECQAGTAAAVLCPPICDSGYSLKETETMYSCVQNANGACGSTVNTCSTGTLKDPGTDGSDANKAIWTCEGSGNGMPQSCSACNEGYSLNESGVCAPSTCPEAMKHSSRLFTGSGTFSPPSEKGCYPLQLRFLVIGGGGNGNYSYNYENGGFFSNNGGSGYVRAGWTTLSAPADMPVMVGAGGGLTSLHYPDHTGADGGASAFAGVVAGGGASDCSGGTGGAFFNYWFDPDFGNGWTFNLSQAGFNGASGDACGGQGAPIVAGPNVVAGVTFTQGTFAPGDNVDIGGSNMSSDRYYAPGGVLINGQDGGSAECMSCGRGFGAGAQERGSCFPAQGPGASCGSGHARGGAVYIEW